MSQDEKIAEAILGRDAEDFLRSELGRYIIGRAKQEKEDAQEHLSTVCSWRKRRIQDLQNQIWRAESIQGWLIELVENGREAQNSLEREHGTADAATV